jgi:hypothetical protein
MLAAAVAAARAVVAAAGAGAAATTEANEDDARLPQLGSIPFLRGALSTRQMFAAAAAEAADLGIGMWAGAYTRPLLSST